jgi:hypothetical protein
MNKKRFIAQQSGINNIKIFNAETGQLYKIINTVEQIVSPPICTEQEMYVSVKTSDNKQIIHYYNIPSFNLKLKTAL